MKTSPNKYPECYVFHWNSKEGRWYERPEDWRRTAKFRGYSVWFNGEVEELARIVLNKDHTRIKEFTTVGKINRSKRGRPKKNK